MVWAALALWLQLHYAAEVHLPFWKVKAAPSCGRQGRASKLLPLPSLAVPPKRCRVTLAPAFQAVYSAGPHSLDIGGAAIQVAGSLLHSHLGLACLEEAHLQVWARGGRAIISVLWVWMGLGGRGGCGLEATPATPGLYSLAASEAAVAPQGTAARVGGYA